MTAASSIFGIDHLQIAIPVGGEDLGRRFYRDVVGLEEIPVPAAVAHLAIAWFKVGQWQIHIAVDPEFHPAKKAHPALLVRNLSFLRDRLKAANATIVEADPLPGRLRCHVFDPFGNRIELIENAPSQV